jgi:hypothetical protein
MAEAERGIRRRATEISKTFEKITVNSKQQLREIDKAAFLSSSDTINDDEDTINALFITIKNNCRALLSYLCENLIDRAQKDSSIENLEQSLVDFEHSFRNFRMLSIEEQMHAVLKLVQMKEKTLLRLSSFFIQYVGVDHCVSAPLSDQMSPDTRELITMFATFKSIARGLKLTELSHSKTEDVVAVSELQGKIFQLQRELEANATAYEQLESKYKAVITDEGRQQILFRQQTTIDELERSNREITRDIQKLRSENRRLIQNEAYVKDQLDQSHQKILKMKESYEKEMNILRPQLQTQIHGILVTYLRFVQTIASSILFRLIPIMH